MVRRHGIHAAGNLAQLAHGVAGSLCRGRNDKRGTSAFPVQAKVLGTGHRDDDLGQAVRHQAHAIGVGLQAIAQALIGNVDKRHEPATRQYFRHGIPLRTRKIRARGVVAAAVQQDEVPSRQRFQMRQHGRGIHAARGAVEIRVGGNLQTGVAEQRHMVGPSGVAQVQCGTGAGDVDQLGTETQRAAASRSLQRSGAAILHGGMGRTKRKFQHGAVEALVAALTHVDLGFLASSGALHGRRNGGGNGRIAGFRLVDTNTEVHLARVRVAAVGGHDAQQRVFGQGLENFEHRGGLSKTNGRPSHDTASG